MSKVGALRNKNEGRVFLFLSQPHWFGRIWKLNGVYSHVVTEQNAENANTFLILIMDNCKIQDGVYSLVGLRIFNNLNSSIPKFLVHDFASQKLPNYTFYASRVELNIILGKFGCLQY